MRYKYALLAYADDLLIPKNLKVNYKARQNMLHKQYYRALYEFDLELFIQK